jgi:Flp pilus assembly protein protease CpaA
MFMVLLLVVAVLHDLTTRRIPNWLVLVGITAALGANLYQGGLEGVLFSLKGLGLALSVYTFCHGRNGGR